MRPSNFEKLLFRRCREDRLRRSRVMNKEASGEWVGDEFFDVGMLRERLHYAMEKRSITAPFSNSKPQPLRQLMFYNCNWAHLGTFLARCSIAPDAI
jgi:hypothetical protein